LGHASHKQIEKISKCEAFLGLPKFEQHVVIPRKLRIGLAHLKIHFVRDQTHLIFSLIEFKGKTLESTTTEVKDQLKVSYPNKS